jgi:glucoamylase
VGRARAAVGLVAFSVAAALVVSGGSRTDPRTPEALSGLPAPFLGTAVVGGGRLTAAIDAYGDVVDLRKRPAGRALIENPVDRQAAGSVPRDTGIVPWVRIGRGEPRPLWSADAVAQRYRPQSNMVLTVARFGSARVRILYAAGDSRLACLTAADPPLRITLRSRQPAAAKLLRCDDRLARGIVRAAERTDRAWLDRGRSLGAEAPSWARQMYDRSLLALRALTDARSGAVAAGARDGWAYVWPRDAAAVALAFEAGGYRREARRVARFLLGLDRSGAARFRGHGEPVPGRGPQGDAAGWIAAAAKATGLGPAPGRDWRDLPDYEERAAGDYLGNALAARDGGAVASRFSTARGLVRRADDPASGLDSAAAWAVEPFRLRSLYPAARETMLRLARHAGRFGITPGEAWSQRDPWSAPTAWTAWSLAALDERHQALRLLGALRRGATPSGLLPERVDVRTGVPTSTTPLAWSHAFAILALRELWPMHQVHE